MPWVGKSMDRKRVLRQREAAERAAAAEHDGACCDCGDCANARRAESSHYTRVYTPRFDGPSLFTTVYVLEGTDWDQVRLHCSGRYCGELRMRAGQGAALCKALHMAEHGAEPGDETSEEVPF